MLWTDVEQQRGAHADDEVEQPLEVLAPRLLAAVVEVAGEHRGEGQREMASCRQPHGTTSTRSAAKTLMNTTPAPVGFPFATSPSTAKLRPRSLGSQLEGRGTSRKVSRKLASVPETMRNSARCEESERPEEGFERLAEEKEHG